METFLQLHPATQIAIIIGITIVVSLYFIGVLDIKIRK
jgi:hypothetical protein